jgi:hypothetical protein
MKEMTKAAAEVARGRPSEAIEHYEDAWKNAQAALKKS